MRNVKKKDVLDDGEYSILMKDDNFYKIHGSEIKSHWGEILDLTKDRMTSTADKPSRCMTDGCSNNKVCLANGYCVNSEYAKNQNFLELDDGKKIYGLIKDLTRLKKKIGGKIHSNVRRDFRTLKTNIPIYKVRRQRNNLKETISRMINMIA